ncbi:autophagocytosis associated protein, putative [Cryptosporidium muris RN66]|uniref:Autophagocytosis associated protein, putative n=1 Tax=Cryptosporidium muris (strain RN66) TaxID=441375 RepID=B6ABA5_CRYMR|nr:autophagocytosis associated protein, putative [Cryptosporidium muris RN66]EEA05657.1 autophagocytosis associated protein, putative [Cryptosporidium muris RN66]|eukprot:XP_002140006.1 autophagocytosis associated protein [Cryptosporidium muris RN66]
MYSLQHRLAENIRSIISHFTPISQDSRFNSDGLISPSEFVDAGDYTTLQFPKWKWRSAEKGFEVPWLPKNKQYLYIQDIASRKRIKDIETTYNCNEYKEWTIAHEINSDNFHNTNYTDTNIQNNSVDIELMSRLRTYDISITYDKYFQIPRMWLYGYNQDGIPLDPKEIVQDIMSEYTEKTITIDPHPCTGISCISIHPCKHSDIFKKIALRNRTPIKHEMAIVILLKFLSSVIPTIELDHTIDVNISL